MNVCVVGRDSAESQKALAQEKGFKLAPQNIANRYLRGQQGTALYIEGNYGLTITDNGLCTVLVHKGNPSTLQQSMEAWLPPSNSGFTYKKEIISQRGSLTTTSYSLFRGNNPLEQWVLTVNNAPNPNLIAMMSYQKQY